MRYGMVIDLLKCQGCQACVVACKAEHGLPPEIQLNRVVLHEVGSYPRGRMIWLPVSCLHCGEAPCIEVCPKEATSRTPEGVVIVDPDRCVGCGACVAACPFGNRRVIRERRTFYPDQSATPYERVSRPEVRVGRAIKCDFCSPRLAQGKRPACVETCPAQARAFGDLDDPRSEAACLLAEHEADSLPSDRDIDPALWYVRG